MRGVDLTGRRFGMLTVLELFAPGIKTGTKKRTWTCQCECGQHSVVYGSNLLTGNTRSCGCERDRLTGVRSAERSKRRKAA